MRDRSRASRTSTAAAGVRPIITLTSDFGLADHYVAAMKAVLITQSPEARLVDITHNVPRHDILCGSITLERAVDGFPPGTVHLAVVDPGVGTDRRLIVVKVREQLVVCPDNGLITWAWRIHEAGRPRAFEITWRPTRSSSSTFHGRDILAPVAARLAGGETLDRMTKPITDPILLSELIPAPADVSHGRIIHIDHFGNATTNIRHEVLRERGNAVSVKLNRRLIGKLRRTYWDVAPGKPLALIGSSGLLEIAGRDGSARDALKIAVGDSVVLR